MGGTINPPSKEQIISDYRCDNEQLKDALKEIINATNNKERKIAIDRARNILYPVKSEDKIGFGWNWLKKDYLNSDNSTNIKSWI